MKAITLTLQTEQPILATSFQGDPNSDVSDISKIVTLCSKRT